MSSIKYSRQELVALNRPDLTPSRSIRKTLFSFRIWKPWINRTYNKFGYTNVSDSDLNKPTSCNSTSFIGLNFGLVNARSVGNKSHILHDVISDRDTALDILLVTETWHSNSHDIALRSCAPSDFTCLDIPRPRTGPGPNHGGVAAFLSSRLRYKVITHSLKPTTFESITFTVTEKNSTVVILLICRPSSVPVTDQFFVELTSLLEVLALYKCQILVSGDINIHFEKLLDVHAIKLRDILDSFDCHQHITEETHIAGGTLDLVITRSDQAILNITVDPPNIISDHSLIRWSLPFDRLCPLSVHKSSRNWKNVDRNQFRATLHQSPLCSPDTFLSSRLMNYS